MSDFSHISLDVEYDLDDWDVAEDRPTGSREKLTLNRKSDSEYFIFKHPKSQREHQIWSELLGSFIAGDLLGWDVQYVALGVLNGKPGNLLRYIYQPDKREEFIEGWRLCKEIDPEFDVARGRRHTFPLILQTYADAIDPQYKIERTAFMKFWSRAFALDTLISNTDRHAENWAIITSPAGSRMAALYDNGTSMGCGYDAVGIDRCFCEDGRLKKDWMKRFRDSGRHHVRLEKPMKHGALFEPLCRRLLDCFPESHAAFEQAAGIDLEAVRILTREIIARVDLPKPYALTCRRAEHICGILEIGMQRIRNILGTRQEYDEYDH